MPKEIEEIQQKILENFYLFKNEKINNLLYIAEEEKLFSEKRRLLNAEEYKDLIDPSLVASINLYAKTKRNKSARH